MNSALSRTGRRDRGGRSPRNGPPRTPPAASGDSTTGRGTRHEPLLARSPRRWVRALPYVCALGLIAVLLPTSALIYTDGYGVHSALSGTLAVAQSVPLLLAVSRPLPAWLIVITADTVGAFVLTGAAPDPQRPWPWPAGVIVGYLALCLMLALRVNGRTLFGVYGVTFAVSLLLGIVGSKPGGEDTSVLLIVLSGVILLLVAAVRGRGEAQRRLAEQETISETERAGRTLLEERTRIARELHDVVAHHMSLVTVQAESAPYRLEGLTPGAREEFGSIAATARESLTEMRHLLGVLRNEEKDSRNDGRNGSEGREAGGDKDRGERAPQPGLDRLGQLVEATVRAGVPARLTVSAEALEPPDAVQLSAYRIVQEALANVVRHARGAVTHVSVTGDRKREGDGGSLTVVVVNEPPPQPFWPPLEVVGTSTGHGLVGMRERVRLIGGSLDTGPLPGGGFRIAARLPLRPKGTATTAPTATSAPTAPAVPAVPAVPAAKGPKATADKDVTDS